MSDAAALRAAIIRWPAAMRALGCAVLLAIATAATAAPETRSWEAITAAARGQTVYWNAWAGDERTNAFIAWVGDEVRKRHGVTVQQVNLKDTAEAVTRVVSEKTAGRDRDGSVDLIWINGPNFLAMKDKGLLHGPFTQAMPNYRLVDVTTKRSNVVDFTVPVDGLESPWRLAQVVYVYDSARHRPESMPRSIDALLDWSRAHPGRLTHPTVRNFLGATFLKQALYELAPAPEVLQSPTTGASFAATTAPLWAWYDKLRPTLWRSGKEFPESGPAQRQLLNDGEIDMLIAFNPSEAATSIANKLLPPTARVFGMANGTIGNTSFVAIPYNAAHKEGAMVVANFLLDPVAQARQQDPTMLGNASVLDLAKLSEAERALFAPKVGVVGLPAPGELGRVLLEPHASWMTRITEEWEKRYSR
ncbi:MAG: ABC transporter substrate-binding protein [Caldimonas sp.]